MEERFKNISDEIRKTLVDSNERKSHESAVETSSNEKMTEIKNSLNSLTGSLKPAFEESGKLLEVINRSDNKNLIEILYYPESTDKTVRGVNTATFRVEFIPKEGKAKILRRESLFSPYEELETLSINDDNSISKVEEAAIEFAKLVASK